MSSLWQLVILSFCGLAEQGWLEQVWVSSPGITPTDSSNILTLSSPSCSTLTMTSTKEIVPTSPEMVWQFSQCSFVSGWSLVLIILYKAPARMVVVACVTGLADSSWISFESVNYPGLYVKHKDFRLRLERDEGSDAMRYVHTHTHAHTHTHTLLSLPGCMCWT